MLEKGVSFPIVAVEFPPIRASLKVKQKHWKRERRCRQSPNAITLMELCEDKLVEVLVISRMANTGNIENLLTIAINAGMLYHTRHF